MRYIAFVFACLAFASCNNKKDEPNVADVQVHFKLERFEQDFFKLDTAQLAAGMAALDDKYPQFFPFYLKQILQVPSGAEGENMLKQIVASYAPINDSIQKKYSSLTWLRQELTNGFKHVKYYYPAYVVPNVVTFIGTFDAPGIVVTPHNLGIGLHQYAGKSFSVYQNQQIKELYPDYISRRFDKEYITPNCFKAIADDVYADSSTGRALIEQMIEKGKQWYLVDHFLPETADSLKTGFTQKQLQWCEANEGNIWGYFIANVDLYTIDPAVIQDYIGEGPFTRGMPEGLAPGNIGQWVGWQIVKAFAEKKKDFSMQEVLNTPAKSIFQEAKYKPR